MFSFSILVKLEAKPGKEKEVEDFLRSALPFALAEHGTTSWFAFKTGSRSFGIFDTFGTEAARGAHLTGDMAKALMAKADRLFVEAPKIELFEILAVKAPSSQAAD